jgi:hypothetical protein
LASDGAIAALKVAPVEGGQFAESLGASGVLVAFLSSTYSDLRNQGLVPPAILEGADNALFRFGVGRQERLFNAVLIRSKAVLDDLWPDLVVMARRAVRPSSREAPEAAESGRLVEALAGKAHEGQGFRVSAVERRQIEECAVLHAIAYFEGAGWEVDPVYREGSFPYDLLCRRNGEELRVEVKGTSGDGSAVLLTPREVAHNRRVENMALFVVCDIELERTQRGVRAVGGRALPPVSPWRISDRDLRPTGYSYSVQPANARLAAKVESAGPRQARHD